MGNNSHGFVTFLEFGTSVAMLATIVVGTQFVKTGFGQNSAKATLSQCISAGHQCYTTNYHCDGGDYIMLSCGTDKQFCYSGGHCEITK